MNKSIFDRRVLVAAGLAAGLGLSQTALAEPATDDLDITAGLTGALTLDCNEPLSFGITRLNTLGRDGETTLTVSASDGTITVDGADDGVTTDSGRAQRGECTISGSAAEDKTEVTVTFETGEGDSVSLGQDEDAFGALDGPGTPLSNLDVGTFETNPETVEIGADGGATFNIGGKLTIPGTVEENNLGGYRGEVTVKVDDGFGD